MMYSPAPAIPPRFATSRSRAAFTLLEVMVALALSTMLVAAVYAALSLYWQYSTTGQDEVERAQLARAILRQIELDLRSVVYKAQAEASDTSSTSGQSSTGGSTSGSSGSSGNSTSGTDTSSDGAAITTTEVVDPETAYATTSSGLYGNAAMLMMHISKPMPELTFMPNVVAANALTRTSDLMAVAYYVAAEVATGTAQSGGTGSGLARMEGDRLAMSLASQGGGSPMSAALTQILAPEVTAIQFSYFDGLSWRADWDSEMLGGIPRAVEILVLIGPSQSLGSTLTADAPNVYRLVVFLPLAKPVDTSTMSY